jgi:primosomal protein N' (replication factor Y)
MPEDADGGVGSMVSVPFHGRTLKGWVLGAATELPPGRLSSVRSVRSAVRFFDPDRLRLFRAMAERYLAPLSVVIDRSLPPRVAGEEVPELVAATRRPRAVLDGPRGDRAWVRPLPGEEAVACVRAVREVVDAGRTAVVVVPEAQPIPFTARAVLEEFGGRAVDFMGGDARSRYRTWLEILAGRYPVVVGTRPAVFAPLLNLGLIWVSREVHPGHREERAPYHHVRDVALLRAHLTGASCLLSSLSPSVDTASMVAEGSVGVRRPPRTVERASAPVVETTLPEAEDRSVRLGRLVKEANSAALVVSRGGYGVARVCRSCGEPAACRECRGPIRSEGGRWVCAVCGAPGECSNCGGERFGMERGGAERVEEWAARIASVPVVKDQPPGLGRILVGTAAAVKDVPPPGLDLVAILDPDRALARAGVHAGERALATWMEAAAWARGRAHGGRVLAQTRRPAHPALQALIRWDPLPYLLEEGRRRRAAGFAPGHPVYRIEGTSALPGALDEGGDGGPETVLATTAGDRTVCLVAVRPARVGAFRERVLRLVGDGVVSRVEAEPQL